MKLIGVLFGLAVTASVLGAAAVAASEPLHGAGATFPAPVYAAWAAAYQQNHDTQITYDAVGSGAGLDRIRQRQVDFGASDAPLQVEELERAGLLQFPVIIGGVVPVINNRMGIGAGQLRLSGPVLADIYLGRIKKWNAAPIAALNPGLALPNTNITVVYRSDPSGSSLLWTEFLSHTSGAWREEVGASLTPKWPAGTGGTGNDGVAAFVQRTRFAIGYVEYIYARNHHLSDVALQNRSGQFVQASRAAFSAAAETADWRAADGFQQVPTDPPGSGSWPITGASFILVDRSPARARSTAQVLQFFDWALHQGGPITHRLDYAPLPTRVVEQLPLLWGTLRDSSGMPLWPH